MALTTACEKRYCLYCARGACMRLTGPCAAQVTPSDIHKEDEPDVESTD